MRSKYLLYLLTCIALFASVAISKKIYKKFFKNHVNQESIEIIDRKINMDDLSKELSILVLSCDQYSELWPVHFHFLLKHWPELDGEFSNVPVYLLSNNKPFEHKRVTTIQIGEDLAWSDNVLKALKHINSKYVLLLLDDYIVTSDVDHARMKELLAVVESNNAAYLKVMVDQGIFVYNFEPNTNYLAGSNSIIYRSKTRDSKFINSLQAAIWNKKALETLLVESESAWDFEIIGNNRARTIKNPFFDLTDKAAMTYLNAVQKRMYEQEAVDAIRAHGYDFRPKILPVYPREEIAKKISNPNYNLPSGKSKNYN